MESKILNAIQYIRTNKKQKVTSRRIYRFINMEASVLDEGLLQELLVKLKTEGKIYETGKGENASFFVNKTNTVSSEQNFSLSSSLNTSVNLESLESFIDNNLLRIKSNAQHTPRDDSENLKRSSECFYRNNLEKCDSFTSDIFLQEEILFLKEWCHQFDRNFFLLKLLLWC